MIEQCKIVITADVFTVYVNVRHGALSVLFPHRDAQFRLQIDTYLFDFDDPFPVQQLLGPNAIRAYGCSVHHYSCHYFSKGRFAFCHATIPPARLCAWVKPCLPRIAQAVAERLPLRHTTTMRRSWDFSSSPIRSFNLPSGMWVGFHTFPALYSSFSLTSSTNAFFWLMSC